MCSIIQGQRKIGYKGEEILTGEKMAWGKGQPLAGHVNIGKGMLRGPLEVRAVKEVSFLESAKEFR